MSQTMLQQSASNTAFSNRALSDYFRNAGEMLAEESAILGAVVNNILAAQQMLTNKAIIEQLMNSLKTTDDVVKGDIIRKTLEIVVNHTLDDI